MPDVQWFLLVAIAYTLGSVSTGYYLVKLLTGQDIRLLGSGSTGARKVSRTLGNLGLYVAKDGIPCTISTNLLYALNAAIRDLNVEEVSHSIGTAATRLRTGLRQIGCNIVAKEENSTPAVTTLVLPSGVDSIDVDRRLEDQGLLISYNSNYLRDRNWIQVCLMGPPAIEWLWPLLNALQHLLPAQQV
jgi:aspartate aminotransferase-like enzyme